MRGQEVQTRRAPGLFLLLLLALVGGSCTPESLVWQYESVSTSGYERFDTSLALDGAGRPQISFNDSVFEKALKLASFDGSAWSSEVADGQGYAVRYTSLALDGSGNPHISYYDGDNGDLKYARYTGSDWQVEAVDRVGDVGWHTSLALDGANRPHISYYDADNGDLKYAYRDSSLGLGQGWHIQTVDSAGQVGRYTSLALDRAGRPHISYYDVGNGDLRYAYNDGSTWHVQTVDSEGAVGSYTSLALDGDGYPHISYRDDSGHGIKYAFQDGTALHDPAMSSGQPSGQAWQIVTVAPTGEGSGGDTAIALDRAGRPHICYCDSSGDGLRYAYGEGTAWRIEPLFSGAPWQIGMKYGYDEAVTAVHADGDVSLTLDEAGRPHVSYSYQVEYSYYLDGEYVYHHLGYAHRQTMRSLTWTAVLAVTWSVLVGAAGVGALIGIGLWVRRRGWDWKLWFRWTLATILAVTGGLLWLMGSVAVDPTWLRLVGILVGGLGLLISIGVGQWLAMRRWVQGSGRWLQRGGRWATVTVIGIGAGFLFGLFLMSAISGRWSWELPNVVVAAFVGAVLGGTVGIGQMGMLRPQARKAGRWAWASTVGWAAGLAVAVAVFDALLWIRVPVIIFVAGATGAAVLGTITGLALVWLLGTQQDTG